MLRSTSTLLASLVLAVLAQTDALGGPFPCDTDDDCPPGDLCTSFFCDQTTHECGVVISDPCCPGDGICFDDDPCTNDWSCDGNGFCDYPPEPEGTPCDDGDPSTDGEACRNGLCTACFPSSAPELQTQFGPVANAGLPEPKQRVLAITAGDAGQQQAIRVKWDAQPNWVPGQGHNLLVGQQKWMTAPFQVCENSGQGLETGPPNCGISPGQPQRWFWTANLTCDSAAAHFADLTMLMDFCTASGEACMSDLDCAAGTCGVDGVIHIVDQGIAPSKNAVQQAIYSVQVIESGCEIAEGNFSSALVVTQPFWGDIGVGADCPVLPPEGVAKLVTDVTNALAKFANNLCAPKKTRVDVNGENLNFKTDIIDILSLLNAFASGSASYNFAAGPACSAGG